MSQDQATFEANAVLAFFLVVIAPTCCLSLCVPQAGLLRVLNLCLNNSLDLSLSLLCANVWLQSPAFSLAYASCSAAAWYAWYSSRRKPSTDPPVRLTARTSTTVTPTSSGQWSLRTHTQDFPQGDEAPSLDLGTVLAEALYYRENPPGGIVRYTGEHFAVVSVKLGNYSPQQFEEAAGLLSSMATDCILGAIPMGSVSDSVVVEGCIHLVLLVRDPGNIPGERMLHIDFRYLDLADESASRLALRGAMAAQLEAVRAPSSFDCSLRPAALTTGYLSGNPRTVSVHLGGGQPPPAELRALLCLGGGAIMDQQVALGAGTSDCVLAPVPPLPDPGLAMLVLLPAARPGAAKASLDADVVGASAPLAVVPVAVLPQLMSQEMELLADRLVGERARQAGEQGVPQDVSSLHHAVYLDCVGPLACDVAGVLSGARPLAVLRRALRACAAGGLWECSAALVRCAAAAGVAIAGMGGPPGAPADMLHLTAQQLRARALAAWGSPAAVAPAPVPAQGFSEGALVTAMGAAVPAAAAVMPAGSAGVALLPPAVAAVVAPPPAPFSNAAQPLFAAGDGTGKAGQAAAPVLSPLTPLLGFLHPLAEQQYLQYSNEWATAADASLCASLCRGRSSLAVGQVMPVLAAAAAGVALAARGDAPWRPFVLLSALAIVTITPWLLLAHRRKQYVAWRHVIMPAQLAMYIVVVLLLGVCRCAPGCFVPLCQLFPSLPIALMLLPTRWLPRFRQSLLGAVALAVMAIVDRGSSPAWVLTPVSAAMVACFSYRQDMRMRSMFLEAWLMQR